MLEEEKIIELYKKHSRELFVYIYRYTGSREASEDMLHDAFVNLINYSSKRDIDPAGVRAFLYKTAHNLCVNQIKRSGIVKMEPLEHSENLRARVDFSEKIISDELNKEIYRLLDGIDPESRSIFIMKKELDMSSVEIAESAGVSDRTVRRKLESVVKYLHENLKKSGYISLFIIFTSVLTRTVVTLYYGCL